MNEEEPPNLPICPPAGDRQDSACLRAYAYQLMRQRIIPTVKIGRSVRVRPADLEEFIARNLGKSLIAGRNRQN